jgi:restriction endonuclease S subunit
MNIDILQQHAEKLVRTPADVAKLRQLILSLAVQGKLVCTNAGFLAKQKHNGGWTITKLGKISRIRTGKLDANASVKDGEYPFFTCSKVPLRINTYSFDTAAVLLAGNGDFNLKCYEGKFDAYQRTYVIEPIGWNLGYCFIALRALISGITDNQRGSAIPYLRLGDITNLSIPLPPLAEQERIVARVDELMGWCDTLEAQLRQRAELRQRVVQAALAEVQRAPSMQSLAALLDPRVGASTAELRQMILSLAVQGKLVAGEGVLEVKKHIQVQDKEQTDRIFADFALPSSWAWVSLNQIGTFSGGMTPSTSRMDFWESGKISWYTSKDIKKDYLNGSELRITEKAVEETRLKLYPAGSIVIVTRSGILKHTLPVSIIQNESTVNQDLKVLVLKKQVLARYIQIMLKGFNSLIISGLVKTGTTVQSLLFDEFCSQKFPLPPFAEQERIVARVDELMALVDQLEALQERADAVGEQVLAGVVG